MYYIILRRRSSSPLALVQPVAVRDAEYYLLVLFVQSFGGPSSPWRLLDIEYNYAVYILVLTRVSPYLLAIGFDCTCLENILSLTEPASAGLMLQSRITHGESDVL
jgi:hypothetical protein